MHRFAPLSPHCSRVNCIASDWIEPTFSIGPFLIPICWLTLKSCAGPADHNTVIWLILSWQSIKSPGALQTSFCFPLIFTCPTDSWQLSLYKWYHEKIYKNEMHSEKSIREDLYHRVTNDSIWKQRTIKIILFSDF